MNVPRQLTDPERAVLNALAHPRLRWYKLEDVCRATQLDARAVISRLRYLERQGFVVSDHHRGALNTAAGTWAITGLGDAARRDQQLRLA